jgi:hypothetical protein
MKRPNFYPNGEVIHYSLPNTYEPSKNKQACGNCAMYSNRRSYCGIWKAMGVKDTYSCHRWRLRYFQR